MTALTENPRAGEYWRAFLLASWLCNRKREIEIEIEIEKGWSL
jgi:hypothetical protein